MVNPREFTWPPCFGTYFSSNWLCCDVLWKGGGGGGGEGEGASHSISSKPRKPNSSLLL